MSPRRFDGWEPAETHEYLNKKMEPCALADAWYTIVTREAEWDENSRGRASRLSEHAERMCPCGCGMLYEVSHDPKQPFIVDSAVCYAQRALAKIRDAQLELHKDNPAWATGRTFYVLPHETDEGTPP